MLVTVRSALDAIDDDASLSEVAQTLARGAVMGGRGNSGIILSQILKGLLETVAEASAFGPRELAAGLESASKLAYDAVADPVEGTILTAITAAAHAASGAMNGVGRLLEVVDAAHRAADRAVTATTQQLAQLTRAGVVDGGAKGFALLLDALLHEIAGGDLPAPPPLPEKTWDADQPGAERWEVVLLLDAADAAARGLKEEWAGIGSSIVIVSDDAVHKCHVHTDDYEKALEMARRAGRISDVAVTELLGEADAGTQRAQIAIAGQLPPAVADLFASLDVGVGPAPIVIALPQATVSAGARVVEADSLPAALATALAFDPDASEDDNVSAMQKVADAVQTHRCSNVAAAKELLAETGGIELATVFIGSELDAEEVVAELQRATPDIAIEVYRSGRSDPAIEIGLE